MPKGEAAILRVCDGGPLVVRGPLILLDEAGHELRVRRLVNALCRCGRSSVQPFCDGTHKLVPFSPRRSDATAASASGTASPPGR